MTDILREIEEDVRRERLLKLWRRVGPYVIGLALAVVVVTAGVLLWQAYERNAREAAAVAFLNAATRMQGDPQGGMAALGALAADGPGVYAEYARLAEAAATGMTDPEAGAAKFDRIAAEISDPFLSGAARLRAAMLLLDRAPRAEIEARLATLAADDNPWRFQARELLAFAALRAGARDEASAQLAALAAAVDVPPGIAERARKVLDRLAQEAAPAAPAIPPPAGAAGDADPAPPAPPDN